MIKLEDEIANFKPVRDVDQVEEAVADESVTDVTDVILKLLKEMQN